MKFVIPAQAGIHSIISKFVILVWIPGPSPRMTMPIFLCTMFFMRNAFLFTLVLALITLAIVSYFYVSKRVYPHTYLGKVNISGLTKAEILKCISSFYDQPFQVKVRDRLYSMKYKQIGIIPDYATTIRLIFANNHKLFPQNIISYSQSFSSQNMILSSLIFSQEYLRYIDTSKLVFQNKKCICGIVAR